MTGIDLERRRLLQRMGTIAAATAVVPGGWLSATASEAATDSGTTVLSSGPFDVDLRLRAAPDVVPILPGRPSEVWRYTGELLKGPADTLARVNESYPGPMIRLRRGQRVRARIDNGLPEDTTVHWHGLHVPPDVDGQPRLPIRPGESMDVAFDVVDRAGLYWYHPHPHGPNGGRVGFQSVAGLAGPLIIEDEAERALGLPAGEQEMVLVLQDRRFTDDNELRYIGGGRGSMMGRMRGFRGDRILINGRPDTQREVATRPYRLRLLNGSNARIYKLAWSDGRPVTVIGTDGGLLDTPRQLPFVTLAPAQRVDVWVDFGDGKVSDNVQLVSEAYESGMMGGGMMRGGGMMGSARFPLLDFHVARQAQSDARLPARLTDDLPLPRVGPETPVRRFQLGMRMMEGFTINGRRMAGTTVADDETVRLGRTEIWEFRNDSMMAHPMHVHGLQFGVVGRDSDRADDLRAGVVDAGLHDTVLVFPGERVRIALTFEDFTGFYMYHCHNMEHEDNGMMRYYRVDA
jgi:FtsP/CotA-like multicopper oxidase with cupredoxin domain